MKSIVVLLIIFLAGCEMLEGDVTNPSEVTLHSAEEREILKPSLYEEKVKLLVDELASLDKYELTTKNTIVSTFVWNETFTSQNDHTALSSLGIDLSEQVKYRLVHHHANVLETQGGKSLAISSEGTYFLSRDLDELYSHLNADYVVTGVMSKQKQGLMVNAFVIDFSSKLIVGSAQQLFPHALFSDDNAVMLKDGKIYISREGY